MIDRALAIDPNNAAAWGYSAWARNWLGEAETAIEHVARAARLSPVDPMAYNWCSAAAHANFLLGRYDEAVAWAERATREAPTYSSAFRVMAASHALAGRMEEARKAGRRLREIDPSLRISDLADRAPIRNPEDYAKLAEGLRKAGVPE